MEAGAGLGEHFETVGASSFMPSSMRCEAALRDGATRAGDASMLGMAGRAAGATQESTPADVLIVTALREEREAVKAVRTGALGEWTDERAPSTGLRIERRSFRAADGSELRVALICAEEMGSAQTVGVAGPAAMLLRPRCLAMCGVLAGKPNDTEFGDVVFADQLQMHDTGKQKEGVFEHATRAHKLDIRWLEKARDFAEDPGDALDWLRQVPPWTAAQERDWLLDQFSRGLDAGAHKALVEECCPSYSTLVRGLIADGVVQPVNGDALTARGKVQVDSERFVDPTWPGLDPPRRSTKVHVAPIASGNAVQADPDIWQELSKFARETLGVEMEMSLTNLGMMQSGLGQREAALGSTQEAVDIRRKLAAERPAAFLPDLAVSLTNLGKIQSELGQREAALASTQEAIDALWPFFVALPAAFARNTRIVLRGVLRRLKALDRPPDPTTCEYVKRYQEITGEALELPVETGTA